MWQWSFQLITGSKSDITLICLTLPRDWSLGKLAPSSWPIRFKTKINRGLFPSFFPRFMKYSFFFHYAFLLAPHLIFLPADWLFDYHQLNVCRWRLTWLYNQIYSFLLISLQVWFGIPIFMVVVSLYLVIAPFYETPLQSFYCVLFVSAAIPFYFAFVRYEVVPRCFLLFFSKYL